MPNTIRLYDAKSVGIDFVSTLASKFLEAVDKYNEIHTKKIIAVKFDFLKIDKIMPGALHS